MGDYEIRARLTGSHSPDPTFRGPGEAVHEFEQWLRKMTGHGHTVHSAEVTHWPGSDQEHTEQLHGGEAEPAAADVAASEQAVGEATAAGDGPAAGATAAATPAPAE